MLKLTRKKRSQLCSAIDFIQKASSNVQFRGPLNKIISSVIFKNWIEIMWKIVDYTI